MGDKLKTYSMIDWFLLVWKMLFIDYIDVEKKFFLK
jgi:hypothetical protein